MTGDILFRRGVKVSGTKVLLTISTKAKDIPAVAGLIFEAYDPLTCTNATLHCGKSELIKEVAFKEKLLLPDKVQDTVESLLYRLVLFRDPVNGMSLKIDGNLLPQLFRFDMFV